MELNGGWAGRWIFDEIGFLSLFMDWRSCSPDPSGPLWPIRPKNLERIPDKNPEISGWSPNQSWTDPENPEFDPGWIFFFNPRERSFVWFLKSILSRSWKSWSRSWMDLFSNPVKGISDGSWNQSFQKNSGWSCHRSWMDPENPEINPEWIFFFQTLRKEFSGWILKSLLPILDGSWKSSTPMNRQSIWRKSFYDWEYWGNVDWNEI